MLLDWRGSSVLSGFVLVGLAAVAFALMLIYAMVVELRADNGSLGLVLSFGMALTAVLLGIGVVVHLLLAQWKGGRASSERVPSRLTGRSAVPIDRRIQRAAGQQRTVESGRILDQLTGAQPVPPVANDVLSASLMAIFGVAGGVVIRTPAAYVDVPAGTPRGVQRPAVVWDDAVLTVDDGKDVVAYGESLVWHLAQLCERCGTLLLARSVHEGLIFIDNSDELFEALEGSYRPFVTGCSNCRAPSVTIPTYDGERDCAPRFSRKKHPHNFTSETPGPWNTGDIVWCLDCGKQSIAKLYLPTFFTPPSGMGGGFGV